MMTLVLVFLMPAFFRLMRRTLVEAARFLKTVARIAPAERSLNKRSPRRPRSGRISGTTSNSNYRTSRRCRPLLPRRVLRDQRGTRLHLSQPELQHRSQSSCPTTSLHSRRPRTSRQLSPPQHQSPFLHRQHLLQTSPRNPPNSPEVPPRRVRISLEAGTCHQTPPSPRSESPCEDNPLILALRRSRAEKMRKLKDLKNKLQRK